MKSSSDLPFIGCGVGPEAPPERLALPAICPLRASLKCWKELRIRYQLFKAFFGLGLFHVRILVVLDGRFLASAFLRILLAVFNAIHFVTGMRNTLLSCEVVDLR